MHNFTPFSRQLLGLILLASIASLFFLCAVTTSMPMNAMGHGTPCGMSHSTDLCPMALNGRLIFWQSLIVPTSSVFDALALLTFLAALAFFWNSSTVLQKIQSSFKFNRYATSPPPFDYLLQQFSQGILQPKIY